MSESTKVNLVGLSLPKMQAFFLDLGEKPFRASQVMRWIHQRGVTEIEQMTDISKSLRQRLAELAEIRLPRIVNQY
ncbi:MAG: 23S rRNA (adenine(2503)-C(2))-methyltransferase RlmN, partial [Gammaproteobacteria bacterium]|nr:23S rRNA (adenine(2503)-C(2))-methyltransferase RlmN [Gammaproteobacteria bacterium]